MTIDEAQPAATPSLRERRRAVTREEIASAALDLFERQGYEATTVEQIADAAGVSLRTFYRHCTGKDDVLTHRLLAGPSELVARIEERADLELVDAVVAGFVAATEPGERRVLRAMVGEPALRSAWLAAGRQAQDELVRVLTQRLPGSTPLEARARASAVTAVLTSVIETWALDPDTSLEQLAREALQVVSLDR